MGVMTLWVLLSFLKSDPDVLPQPWQVAEVIIEEYHSGRLWLHASATFGRVAVTFCLAMSVGFVIGLLLGTHRKLDNFFSPWIILLQNLPALVVIVLCYLWIGLNETAAILAVCINKTAMVAVTRFRDGYTQNGITKMPAFVELLGQKAAWAIRTYIETRPDDGALDERSARLEEIRDELGGWQDGDTQPLIAELRKIAEQIETGSGAPVADSAAFRALTLIDRKNPNFAEAANQLTIGLSAAR